MLSASGDSRDPEKVLEAIVRRADEISSNGMDEQLFERLKRSSLGRRMRDLDSFSGVCYKMCAYHFEGVDYFAFPEVFAKVSQEDVANFLKQTVKQERAALSVVRTKI